MHRPDRARGGCAHRHPHLARRSRALDVVTRVARGRSRGLIPQSYPANGENGRDAMEKRNSCKLNPFLVLSLSHYKSILLTILSFNFLRRKNLKMEMKLNVTIHR